MMSVPQDEEQSPTYHLNLYESNMQYEIVNFIDSIELDYIPYQQTNTTYGRNNDSSSIIVNGSDHKCHVYFYDRENHTFFEVDEDDLAEIFPELIEEFSNVPLWISFYNDSNNSKRITIIGLESGTFLMYIGTLSRISVLSVRGRLSQSEVIKVML